jgi:2-keto-myo-inositol isomerase
VAAFGTFLLYFLIFGIFILPNRNRPFDPASPKVEMIPMPNQNALRFAFNHMVAPALSADEFFALSARLGGSEVEIRNDLKRTAILDGTPATAIRESAKRHGQTILTINALQRFNEWTPARAAEATDLARWCRDTGAAALILVPTNDGTGCADGVRQENLRTALRGLAPILESAGIRGFIEPLGFSQCALRYKSEAAGAIVDLGLADRFRITHDTFHHHLAGEAAMFPEHTGLIHISGVDDPSVAVDDMLDAHRVLVGPGDRIGNTAQIAALLAAGVTAPCSFEPFADAVHQYANIEGALAASMAYIREALARQAA